jgi:16S rRNA (cytosine1402-N4)-methyltransferase
MNPTLTQKGTSEHKSVLFAEAVECLAVKADDVVVDATIGGAGHFGALLESLGSDGTLIGIDADAEAIERAREVLNGKDGSTLPKVFLQENNFRNLESILDELEIESIDKSLFDLGWSGFQLSRSRGFSFQNDEPLLMTYGDPQTEGCQGVAAADVLNSASEETLADILYTLGEEQFSRKIARAIVDHRKHDKILTTTQLVEVIKAGTPDWYHHRRLHPATKTFQALRIYVNDELGALREGLAAAINRTSTGGRIAVISFHSIEDRIVKNVFRDEVAKGMGTLVSKKPITPSPAELAANPRARSAKLRVFECGAPAKKYANHKPLQKFTNVDNHQSLYA